MYTHTPMCAHSRARTHAPMCTHIAVHTQPCISTHTGTHVTHVHIHTGTGAHVHSKCPPTPEGTHMCTRNALTGHTHPCAGPEFHILQGDRGARPSPTFPGPGLRHWFRAEGPAPLPFGPNQASDTLARLLRPRQDTRHRKKESSLQCSLPVGPPRSPAPREGQKVGSGQRSAGGPPAGLAVLASLLSHLTAGTTDPSPSRLSGRAHCCQTPSPKSPLAAGQGEFGKGAMVSEGHPYICTRNKGPRGQWASHPCEGACQRGGAHRARH